MKPIIYSIIFMVLFPEFFSRRQDKIYTTSSGELIFSFASVDYPGTEEEALCDSLRSLIFRTGSITISLRSLASSQVSQ